MSMNEYDFINRAVSGRWLKSYNTVKRLVRPELCEWASHCVEKNDSKKRPTHWLRSHLRNMKVRTALSPRHFP